MVLAAQINTTIDDQSPLVTYRAQIQQNPPGFNTTLLNNGTVTFIPATPTDSPTIGMNFTGTAVYVFVAYPSGFNESFISGFIARIDDVPYGGWSVDQTAPLYNHLAYANKTLSNGPHSLVLQIQPKWELYFDYLVYTSGDPDPGTTPSSTSGTLKPQSTSPTVSASSAGKKKAPIGAVVGGVVVGVILLALAATLFFLRRRAHTRRRKSRPFTGALDGRSTPDGINRVPETSLLTPFPLQSPSQAASKHMREKTTLRLGIDEDVRTVTWAEESPLSPSDSAIAVMAREMRRLTATVQRLETGIPEARDGGPILQRPPAYGIRG
ncbi:hypothetical protein K438DRAFT_1827367 [Mycena galopus ATCC 62051]|nr:hypothetical protein K438DRAFT_1827367 [Mycena galopus ATCC 62051]